ncbi:uncharacterized protein [Nicotiana tomentosiformis]|uniref:uncharacterized protein n=1 Tax=Nicotiana tomentosiformis TaxID=4098 RepID=UPI00388C9C2A
MQSYDEVRIDIDDNVEETQEEVNPSRNHVLDIPESVVQKAKASLSKTPPLYPQSLAKKNEVNQFKRFIDMMGSLSINVSLVEALEQMPGYARFMKDLVTKNRSINFKTIKVTHQVSEMVHSMAPKLEDPSAFAIPCTIGSAKFAKALYDFGSIDYEVPIILGQTFLATGKDIVNVEVGELTFRVGDEKVVFHVCKSIRQPNSNEVDSILAVQHKRKKAIWWTLADIRGISPTFCMHKINLEEDAKPSIEYQRRLNVAMQDVVKKDIIKWLDTEVVYPISDSSWTSPLQCVLKKGGMTVVTNDNNELIPKRTSLEVFMDDFLLVGDAFDDCLANLDKVLTRCDETNLVLNWEKCHFMVEEGIVLGHKISKNGIEVDKAKIEVISKLPPLTSVKGVRTVLGHTVFYRCFIKDFSKVVNPLCKLLEKDAEFHFNDDFMRAF